MSHLNNQSESTSTGVQPNSKTYHSPNLVALGPLQDVILKAATTPDGAVSSTVGS